MKSLFDIVRGHVRSPSQCAVIETAASGRRTSYAQLLDRASRFAGGLLTQNIISTEGPDDEGPVIAFHMHRGADFVAALLGAIETSRFGLAFLSRDMQDEVESLRNVQIIEEIPNVRLLITDDDELLTKKEGALFELLAKARIPVWSFQSLMDTCEEGFTEEAFYGGADEWSSVWPIIQNRLRVDKNEALPVLPDSAALYYMFTGGTTSASKCVKATRKMVMYELQVGYRLLLEESGFCKSDEKELRCLNYFSLYWAASSLGELNIALAVGGTLVVAEYGSKVSRSEALVETVNLYEVNVFGAVPSILKAIGGSFSVPSANLIFTWGGGFKRLHSPPLGFRRKYPQSD